MASIYWEVYDLLSFCVHEEQVVKEYINFSSYEWVFALSVLMTDDL